MIEVDSKEEYKRKIEKKMRQKFDSNDKYVLTLILGKLETIEERIQEMAKITKEDIKRLVAIARAQSEKLSKFAELDVNDASEIQRLKDELSSLSEESAFLNDESLDSEIDEIISGADTVVDGQAPVVSTPQTPNDGEVTTNKVGVDPFAPVEQTEVPAAPLPNDGSVDTSVNNDSTGNQDVTINSGNQNVDLPTTAQPSPDAGSASDLPDGSVIEDDGTRVFKDGTRINPDGSRTSPQSN